MKFIYPLCFSAFLLLPWHLKAQWGLQQLRFSVLHESQSLPGAAAFQPPYRPGVQAGLDVWVRQSKHWQQSAGADLTYYYQPLAEHALLLNLNYRFGVRIGSRLGIHLLAGAGYKHSILPGPVYQEENGSYERKTHWGTPQFNVKTGIGLSMQVHPRLTLLAEYSFVLATHPGLFPFSPHSLVALGGVYQLQPSKS